MQPIHPTVRVGARWRPRGAVLSWLSAGAAPLLGLIGAFAVPNAQAQSGLSHPPALRDLAPDSALVWARARDEGALTILYRRASDEEFSTGAMAAAQADGDFTMQWRLSGLEPGTTYVYRLQGSSGFETTDAFFTTPVADPTQLRFAVLGDFSNKLKSAPALRAATTTRPAWVAVIGDLDHRDPATDPQTRTFFLPDQADLAREAMRSMRRGVLDPATALGADFNQALSVSTVSRGQIPLYDIWDDHDFCRNNADASCPWADLSRQVYREYFAGGDASPCHASPTWRRLTFGALAEVFILDGRSQRTAASLLGDCQRQWLLDGLASSAALWKIILSPVTFNPLTKPFDGWGGYPAEREQLLAWVQDRNLHNIVLMSADIHSGGAIDDGSHAGLPEVSVPHANMPKSWVNTYCKVEKNVVHSAAGTWTLGSLTEANIGVAPVRCGSNQKAGLLPGTLGPGPYPLDGAAGGGYVDVELTASEAVFTVRSTRGEIKQGVRADGTPAAMQWRQSAVPLSWRPGRQFTQASPRDNHRELNLP